MIQVKGGGGGSAILPSVIEAGDSVIALSYDPLNQGMKFAKAGTYRFRYYTVATIYNTQPANMYLTLDGATVPNSAIAYDGYSFQGYSFQAKTIDIEIPANGVLCARTYRAGSSYVAPVYLSASINAPKMEDILRGIFEYVA